MTYVSTNTHALRASHGRKVADALALLANAWTAFRLWRLRRETERLIARMADLLPLGIGLGVHQRLRLATGLIISALQIIDCEAKPGSVEAQAFFDNSVAMAAAAMAAPLLKI